MIHTFLVRLYGQGTPGIHSQAVRGQSQGQHPLSPSRERLLWANCQVVKWWPTILGSALPLSFWGEMSPQSTQTYPLALEELSQPCPEEGVLKLQYRYGYTQRCKVYGPLWNHMAPLRLDHQSCATLGAPSVSDTIIPCADTSLVVNFSDPPAPKCVSWQVRMKLGTC